MSEVIKRHWQEQLEFAEKLRENAIRELAKIAMQDQVQLPFDKTETLPEIDNYY